MSDLVKRWVCGGLEEEVWRAWEVGEALRPLTTRRESLCRLLISGHWEKTCALHRPQLESCLDSACEEGAWTEKNEVEKTKQKKQERNYKCDTSETPLKIDE